jgi:hypothetical protein
LIGLPITGYTRWDHRRYENTLTELQIYVEKNILEVTEEKRLRWFGHVRRMPGNRLPLKVLE